MAAIDEAKSQSAILFALGACGFWMISSKGFLEFDDFIRFMHQKASICSLLVSQDIAIMNQVITVNVDPLGKNLF